MKSIFAVAFALAVVPATLGQTSGRAEGELLKANRAYDEALVRGDSAALDRMYSNEFVYTTSMANCVTKRNSWPLRGLEI